MKWSVVIPSNRPENLENFLIAWQSLFAAHDVNTIIVYDNEEGWKDLPDFIPRKTDMIRSWGMYQAWQTDCDAVVTLDDDVRPIPGIDIFNEYEAQFYEAMVADNFFNIADLTNSSDPMRGFPFSKRQKKLVAVQYGGWDGTLDYDAQVGRYKKDYGRFERISMAVPKGIGVTGCIMNTAWLRMFTPVMWQLPLVNGRYNRYGDIWSGLFIKKTMDIIGNAVVINGKASVLHTRASDQLNNYIRELPGVSVNEGLWDKINEYPNDPRHQHDIISVYRAVTDMAIAHFQVMGDHQYAGYFRNGRDKWLSLFA